MTETLKDTHDAVAEALDTYRQHIGILSGIVKSFAEKAGVPYEAVVPDEVTADHLCTVNFNDDDGETDAEGLGAVLNDSDDAMAGLKSDGGFSSTRDGSQRKRKRN